jgi:hypothetical protein
MPKVGTATAEACDHELDKKKCPECRGRKYARTFGRQKSRCKDCEI